MTSELEARLRDLGATLEFPPVPDRATAVIARLPQRRRRRRGWPRRTLSISFGVALLGAGTAIAVPPSRNAILRVLGLRGARIERVQNLPPLPSGTPRRLELGTRVTLADARHAASFTALLPARATAAYLAHDISGGRVSLLVGPVLVIELRAKVAPFIVKIASKSTHVTRVRVNGGPGVYLFGAPHEVLFESANGTYVSDRVRLAGNVLIWQQGTLTIRIEGTHTLHAALALARTLR